MSHEFGFDQEAAHRYFSVHCFNRAWDLLDKAARTAEEDAELLRLSLASHWHWSQRPDFTPRHASIGYWQTSRACAALGDGLGARRYGELALSAASRCEDDVFCVGYAHEALGRAAKLAGDGEALAAHLAAGREAAAQVADAEDREQLQRDLASLGA